MLGLEAWPRPRGLSRPKFCGLGLGLEGSGLGLGLEGPGLVEAGAEATIIVIMILSYLIVVFTIYYVDCIDFSYFIIGSRL